MLKLIKIELYIYTSFFIPFINKYINKYKNGYKTHEQILG